jgi:hypothetical protein
MPVEREEAYEASKSTSESSMTRLFKPLPSQAGQRFDNELFFSLFTPEKWAIYNRSAEDRDLYGLTEFNPFTVQGKPTINTFYFKVFCHNIENFVKRDGNTGYASVICPKNMNEYLVKALDRAPMFKEDSCPICKESARIWTLYNRRWEEMEAERGITRKGMTTEGKRNIAEADPQLKELYAIGRKKMVMEKYITSVFDHSKFSGKRSMDEGETTLSYQTFFAPKTIVDILKELWKANSTGQAFYSFDNPQGLQIVSVIKSTEACRGKNFRDTKYTTIQRGLVQYPEQWQGYLKNLDNAADPSDLLLLLTQADLAMYAQDGCAPSHNSHPTSYNVQAAPAQPPVVPQMSRPQVSQMQVPSVPQAPQMQVPQVPAMQVPQVPQVSQVKLVSLVPRVTRVKPVLQVSQVKLAPQDSQV